MYTWTSSKSIVRQSILLKRVSDAFTFSRSQFHGKHPWKNAVRPSLANPRISALTVQHFSPQLSLSSSHSHSSRNQENETEVEVLITYSSLMISFSVVSCFNDINSQLKNRMPKTIFAGPLLSWRGRDCSLAASRQFNLVGGASRLVSGY